ncbi:MAG: tryptophan--tRNA ligase [Conexivisphaerales archaeon]
MSQHDKNFEVTPWQVSGQVDYDKLIKQFGTQHLTQELRERLLKDAGERNYIVERGIYYSHRDLDILLDEYEKGERFFLYTGRGPSGPMHIGHIVQFYFTSWLQKRFNANVYIQVTDDERFLQEKGLSLEDTARFSYENILDIIAAGFDPDKTFIFQNTEFMGRMYRLTLKIAQKVNFSVVRAVFGFTSETNIGFVFYPAVQIAPSLFERRRCLIPSAIDQDPFWRIQRDIAESLGYKKTSAIHSKFLPSLTGPAGKMSASMPETAIYLSDDEKRVRDKIWKNAFSGGRTSIEEHRRFGGNPDVDVSYQWLYMFFEPDDKRIRQIREEYVSGKMLSGELKQILIEKVNSFLDQHRKRREKAKDEIELYKRNGKLASKMWEADL